MTCLKTALAIGFMVLACCCVHVLCNPPECWSSDDCSSVMPEVCESGRCVEEM